MRNFLVLVLSIACFTGVWAQSEVEGVVTYDVVYLTGGGVLKGEIKALDEQTGGISFVDVNGKHYFLVAGDYEYYVEDKVYNVKDKGPKEVYPRKKGEPVKSIGFVANNLVRSHRVDGDTVWGDFSNGYPDIGLGVELGIGKASDDESYLGGFARFGLITESDIYLTLGGEYQYAFRKPEANRGGYVPIQVYYNMNQFDMEYPLQDVVDDDWYENVEVTHHSLGVAVGYGMRWYRADMRAVVAEFQAFTHMLMGEKFDHGMASDPDSEFDLNGWKLVVGFEF